MYSCSIGTQPCLDIHGKQRSDARKRVRSPRSSLVILRVSSKMNFHTLLNSRGRLACPSEVSSEAAEAWQQHYFLVQGPKKMKIRSCSSKLIPCCSNSLIFIQLIMFAPVLIWLSLSFRFSASVEFHKVYSHYKFCIFNRCKTFSTEHKQ